MTGMGWSTYWLPNLTTWLLGGGIGAVASTVVGLLVRRWILQVLGQQQRTSEDAITASQQAAQTATATGETVEEMKQRMDGLLTALLRQESLALKVRDLDGEVGRMLQFMAELEHDRHITGQHLTFKPSIFDREQQS